MATQTTDAEGMETSTLIEYVGRAIIFASDDDDQTWKCATIQAKTLSLLKALMGGQLTKVFQVSYL